MARTAEEILEMYIRRRNQMGPIRNHMAELQSAYNGDVTIPLPELSQSERPAVANLIAMGLDQSAMRIASTVPDVFYPPDKPGQPQSEKFARIRRQATQAWWHHNKMRLKMRRRARWLIGYSSAPVLIRPNFELQIPMWHIRNPLQTFPPPGLDPDQLTPPDCIFSFSRSLAWLNQHYPEQTRMLRKDREPRAEDAYDVIEYVDDNEFVMAVCGRPRDRYEDREDGRQAVAELERIPNRAGMCPVVIPGRITLDRPQGQYDGMLGMYQSAARLMALEQIAVERGIFPDTYLVSRPGETADFVVGPFDGRSGKVNVVRGGDIKEVQTNPGFQTNPTIDRLERAQRLTGGIPSEFGGESSTNVRTGRRGDAILSAVVDFPIQEAQELFAESLSEENKRAIAVDKTYFNHPKSFYIPTKGNKGRVDYTPGIHFTSDTNFVSYSHAGADINSLVIGIGQRIGIGTLSKRTGQELDPLIDDAELEHDRTIHEALEQAVLQSVQQQAATGAIPPADVARIAQLVLENKESLVGAIIKVQQEAQAAQAAMAAAPPGAPETQPGLGPTPGPGQAPPAVPPPGPSIGNLANLLGQLRRPQMEIAGG